VVVVLMSLLLLSLQLHITVACAPNYLLNSCSRR
jgi:hypothetical protein